MRMHAHIDCETGETSRVPYSPEEEAAADLAAQQPEPDADNPLVALQRQVETLTTEMAKATSVASLRAAAQAAVDSVATD